MTVSCQIWHCLDKYVDSTYLVSQHHQKEKAEKSAHNDQHYDSSQQYETSIADANTEAQRVMSSAFTKFWKGGGGEIG